MTRVNIVDLGEYGQPQVVGSFDPAHAEMFDEATHWEGTTQVSVATGSQWNHEALYRTAGARWVVHHWSRWPGLLPHYRFVADDTALGWLLRNGHSEAAERHFGGPGRRGRPRARGPGRAGDGKKVSSGNSAAESRAPGARGTELSRDADTGVGIVGAGGREPNRPPSWSAPRRGEASRASAGS
ncbi:MAG: hypothetical protein ACXVHC_06265 [Frankiaceae bacterium]